jgi:Rap1a immunity proteins
MRTIICGGLMALMITATNAAGEDKDSANYLLPYCKLTPKEAMANTKNASIHGRCAGMVEAIGLMFGALKYADDKGWMRVDRNLFCVDYPDGVTSEQELKVVVRYGKVHPEETHQSFTLFAMHAIRKAWPCKN